MSGEILKEYEEKKNEYEVLKDVVVLRIKRLLERRNISVHRVNGRIKTLSSLSGKLANRPGRYKELKDVTDICGVRITTYMTEEIEEISKLLKENFVEDTKNSVDKRVPENPVEFGYSSLHLILSLPQGGSDVDGVSHLLGFSFEVQVRSILQHAWAEIEHDVGYKGGEVPSQIRRKFSRLAGILELADEEFLSIRKTTDELRRSISQLVEKTPASVRLSIDVLQEFVSGELVKNMDKELAKLAHVTWTGDAHRESLSISNKALRLFGISNVQELTSECERLKKTIPAFMAAYLKLEITRLQCPRGVTLTFLPYVLAGERNEEKLTEKLGQILEYAEGELKLLALRAAYERVTSDKT